MLRCRRVACFVLASLAPALSARAQSTACTPADLLGHVAALSADSLRGRAPGSAGDRSARAYLARALAGAGITPAGIAGYAQPVRLHRGRIRTVAIRLSGAHGVATVPATAFRVHSPSRAGVVSVEAALAWAGFGIDAAEYQVHDYALGGGTAAVVRDGTPPTLRARLPYQGADAYSTPLLKAWTAHAHGAKALIVLTDSAHLEPGGGWTYYADADTAAAPVVTVTVDSIAFLRAVAEVDSIPGDPQPGSGRAPGTRIQIRVRQEIDDATSANLVAAMPGQVNEWILLSAHHDGLGVGAPDATGDSIYNGAQDDALGVATALCIAQSLARSDASARPRRGLLVLFTAGEEHGMLGSRYWAMRPPNDAAVRFAINLDALGVSGPTEDVIAYGSTTLTDVGAVRGAIESHGFTLTQTRFEENMYFAFDAMSFASAGIPAITLGQGTRLPGMSPQETFQTLRPIRQRYHSPSDELRADWSPVAVGRYLEVAQAIVAALLETAQLPTLMPNGPYTPLTPIFRR